VLDPYTNEILYFNPHKKHVNLVKHFYFRGYYVIVWSAAGGLWAKAVVDALNISGYVDLVMAKPEKYVDDLPSTDWMGNRIYLKEEETNDEA
jgi:hypothetical protein